MLLPEFARRASAQIHLYYLDEPPAPVTPVLPPTGNPPASVGQQPFASEPGSPPPSLGQQPFPPEQVVEDLTPSQSNNNQLNQLFLFESTPDICAAGEGYLNTNVTYFKQRNSVNQFRYQLQGQYAFTDQIAVGAFLPGITNQKSSKTTGGLGDAAIYGQYKFDTLINPQIVDLTAQLDVVLPTGDNGQMRDTGKFGVRPLLLAYKDFGHFGPGDFGAYGLFGFTITSNSDLRVGLAGTYQVQDLVGILEFFNETGVRGRSPLVEITPGLSFRGISPWEISAGVPIGCNKGTPTWGVVCKLTYVFQK
jgi:hypothetical protein